MGFRTTPFAWCASMALLAWLAAGCSTMTVREKAILVEPVPVADDEECDVRFFASTAPVLEECRVVAQISLLDRNTRTSLCGTRGVRATIRRVACRYGANVAVTSRIVSPLSTCAETDASLYRCDEGVLPPRPLAGEPWPEGADPTR